jgi:hypothetical protein
VRIEKKSAQKEYTDLAVAAAVGCGLNPEEICGIIE